MGREVRARAGGKVTLANALAQHGHTLKGPRCSVCSLLARIDPTDGKILREALADSSYTHNGIARALRAEGYNVSASTLSRHRKGECLGEPK